MQVLFILSSAAASGSIVNIWKFIFGRARPIVLKREDDFGFFFFEGSSNYHSFPSGHTTFAFSVATALALLFPKHAPYFFAYAVLMALSRVLNWDHYISDVTAAAFLGYFTAQLLYNNIFKTFVTDKQ